MNIATLKEILIEDTDKILLVMESIGLSRIQDLGKEFRASKYEDSNPTGTCVKKDDNISYFYNGTDGSQSGDIITLVQDMKGLNLKEAIGYICSAIGIDVNFKYTPPELPFGGYFKGLVANVAEEVITTYPETLLEEYPFEPSLRFFKDNISLEVQKEFHISYDYYTSRIVVPWRTPEGDLVGLMGRFNDSVAYIDENMIAKWKPLSGYAFEKNLELFGYHENSEAIKKKSIVLIGESEKFVMQMKTMYTEKIIDGEVIKCYMDNALALGKHSISSHQVNLINRLSPKYKIVCFDEGLEEEIIKKEAMKLKTTDGAYVGYIYDEDNKYLPKGSTASPSDLGIEIFMKLFDECIKWI